MRCIVTGGLGYIGTIVVDRLLKSGHEIVVIDPCFFGHNKGTLDLAYYSKYTDFPGFEEGDTIVHLGGLSNDPMANYDPVANTKINTGFTAELAEDFSKVKGKRFIFASSASVYGYVDHPVNEMEPINPNSAYAESKYHAEEKLLQLHEDHGFELVILRKATVMGKSPRQRLDLVVNAMVTSAFIKGEIHLDAGGETWRPLVHVDDVARCYEFFVEKEEVPSEQRELIFNLVHKNYRISELGLYIKHLLSKNGEIRIVSDYDSKECRSYLMDGSKLENYGFHTKEGVMKAVNEIWKSLVTGEIDPTDPIYYNIKWLHMAERICNCWGYKFNLVERM